MPDVHVGHVKSPDRFGSELSSRIPETMADLEKKPLNARSLPMASSCASASEGGKCGRYDELAEWKVSVEGIG
jgi:hypothetical protein